MLERRKFLKMGVLSVFSTGLVLGSARIGLAKNSAAGSTTERSDDLPLAAQQDPVLWFKAETFKPYVGGFFEAPNAVGGMVGLELISVRSFKPSKSALRVTTRPGESESFALSFKAAAPLPTFYFHTQDQTSFPG